MKNEILVTVNDILNDKGRNAYSVSPNATVCDALNLMAEKNTGAVVVVENNKVVGILSERDFARKVACSDRTTKEILVKEIMTPHVFHVEPETTVEECMVLMTGKKVRHLPVFEKEKLAGIISIGDVVKYIISHQEMMIEQLSNYISGKYV